MKILKKTTTNNRTTRRKQRWTMTTANGCKIRNEWRERRKPTLTVALFFNSASKPTVVLVTLNDDCSNGERWLQRWWFYGWWHGGCCSLWFWVLTYRFWVFWFFPAKMKDDLLLCANWVGDGRDRDMVFGWRSRRGCLRNGKETFF